jgi:hypothetical protein
MATANASAVIGPTPRLGLQQLRHFVSLSGFFRRLVQLSDLLIQTLEQNQQVLTPLPRPTFERQLAQRLLSCLTPQLALLLHPAVHRQMLQPVFHPRPDLHQLVPMDQQLPHIPLLSRRHPQPRKPPLPQ